MNKILKIDDSLKIHRIRMIIGYWQVSAVKSDIHPKCIY